MAVCGSLSFEIFKEDFDLISICMYKVENKVMITNL
jgi:hypothetical protein